MENCIYCTKVEKRESLMFEICELPNSYVYLMKDQYHAGRCVISVKGHHTEYFQMPAELNSAFFAEMTKVSEAIYNIYKPERINFLTMGDNMKHLHMHICPKSRELPSWAGFINGHEEVYLTDDEYEKVIAKLKEEILKFF